MQSSSSLMVKALFRFAVPMLLGLWLYEHFVDRDAEPAIPTERRVPATNPPIEPDRPDLWEEPRIEPDAPRD